MGLAHHFEEFARAWSRLEDFDHRTRTVSRVKVDNFATSRDQRFLKDGCSHCCAKVPRCFHIVDQHADVVQTFLVLIAPVLKNRRSLVVLADESLCMSPQ